jgi:ubiquinone/menaquinone biosynthesis C-methylase UbiE
LNFHSRNEDILPLPNHKARAPAAAQACAIPRYLSTYYWWAYIHPRALRIFEHPWIVNLILFGNYARLREVALDELGEHLPGRTLQVACVYGNLTSQLCRRVAASGGSMDVVDVLPIQLGNLRSKLPPDAPATLMRMDSSALDLPDESYDRTLLFFLLHEQPRQVRERTVHEALRVTKPGGKVVIVDYARPRWWHPLRYLWRPLLARLEPFALDLWREDIAALLPAERAGLQVTRDSFFGGLYQKVVISR